MLRLWWTSFPPNAWTPSHSLVTMTRDDDLPGAVHPRGRRQ